MNLHHNQKTVNKIAIVSLYLSISTLTINGLHFTIRRHRMDKKQNKTKKHQRKKICYPQDTLALKTHRVKMWKKDTSSKWQQTTPKKVVLAILLSDKNRQNTL